MAALAARLIYILACLLSCRGISTIGRLGVATVVALTLAALWLPAAASAAVSTISGEVTALAGGAPVLDARVCAAEAGGEFEFEFECAYTEADGTYELNVQPGHYRVMFEQGESGLNLARQYYNGVDRFFEASQVTVTSGGAISGIDEALPAGGSIAGKVTAAATGAPIREVEVCSYWEEEEFDYCVETAIDGTYEITGLQPGPHEVEFWAPYLGYETQFYLGKSDFSESNPVPVAVGATTANVNAAMALGGRISGHVYTAAGHQPVGGILVCAVGAASGRLQSCAESGSAGGYQLQSLPAGAYKVGFSLEFREFFPEEEAEPDGWPTQFWNLKSKLSEADVLNVPHSGLITGVDGLLGYVPPTPSPATGSTQTPTTSPTPIPVRPASKPLRCKKGFVKKRVKGKSRCVRRPHHHHRHHRHH